LAPPELPGFLATADPAATLSSSADFPVWPVIRLPCSADFATGWGGLLQLLCISLSACRHYHPASVVLRVSQSA